MAFVLPHSLDLPLAFTSKKEEKKKVGISLEILDNDSTLDALDFYLWK